MLNEEKCEKILSLGEEKLYCEKTFSLEEGKLCLDFVNTVSWRFSKKRKKETLNNFIDLISWVKKEGILEDITIRKIMINAPKQPDKVKRIYKRTIKLRELCHRIFSNIATKGHVPTEDLLVFNDLLADSMGKSCYIAPNGNGFVWAFSSAVDSIDLFLNPIIKSAADFLVSPNLKRLKQCADEYCGGLFIDKSRNNSRRWCSMNDCGNRAKAHRHYLRKCKEKSNATENC